MRLWRLSSARHARDFSGGYGLLHSGRCKHLAYFPHIAGMISREFPAASGQEGGLRDAEQIEELAL